MGTVIGQRDVLGHSTYAMVEKWNDPDKIQWVRNKTGLINPAGRVLRAFFDPDEVVEDDTPNLTVTTGLGRLTERLIGSTANPVFSGVGTTLLAVGSGATTEVAANTDLQTPSWYQVADSTPTQQTTTVTNDTIRVIATFDATHGNVAWAEWGLVLATTAVSASTKAGTGTSPILFNRKTAALGTKVNPAVWTLTVNLTWS